MDNLSNVDAARSNEQGKHFLSTQKGGLKYGKTIWQRLHEG